MVQSYVIMYAFAIIRVYYSYNDLRYASNRCLFFLFTNYSSLLMNKLTFQIPTILKLSLFFNLIKLEDIDEVQIYNYLYLFKYFFGKRAYLSRVKSFFNVGK